MAEPVKPTDNLSIGDQLDIGLEAGKNANKSRLAGFKAVAAKPEIARRMLITGVISVLVIGFGIHKFNKANETGMAGAASVDEIPKVKGVASLGGEISPEYKKLQETENQDGALKAAQTGDTHIDTILPANMQKLEAPTEAVPQVQVIMPEVPQQITVAPQPVQTYQQTQYQRSTAYDQNLTALLASWTPGKHASVSFDRQGEEKAASNAAGTAQANAAGLTKVAIAAASGTSASANNQDAVTGPTERARMGSMMQVILTMGANSDEPGPVMAEVIYGKYKGAKVSGSFSMGKDKLTLVMNQLSLPYYDNAVPIDGLAVDPATGNAAMAVEVDRHYFERIALPFMARFVVGYGQAVARSGTVITNSALGGSTIAQGPLDGKQQLLSALGAGAEAAGQVFNQGVNTKVTVKIPAGTPMAIVFLKDTQIPVDPNSQ